MDGNTFIAELKRKFGARNNSQLAQFLGTTDANLSDLSQKTSLTPRQVSGLMQRLEYQAKRKSLAGAIEPLVEYYEIDLQLSKQGANWLILNKKSHNYSQIYEWLVENHGIYVFFDSIGRALYIGKAKKTWLWDEMNAAFNREMSQLNIYSVGHPYRRSNLVPAYKRERIIRKTNIKLYDCANYFSAYKVDDLLIDGVEALITRTFANNLVNVKVEKFKNLSR